MTKQTSRNASRLNYSIRRLFVDEFHSRILSGVSKNCLVLDLGGNKINKRGQFNIHTYDVNVVYMNFFTTKQPDVQSDATHIPFQTGCFDVVICSELLEHIRQPVEVLYQTHRVLRKGGTLLICVPFLYRIHGDPYDFGRYTDHFWRLALSEIGFHSISIERQGLYYSVLADFIKQYVNKSTHRIFRKLFRQPVFWFQRWALRYEKKKNIINDPFISSFTTGYGIVAIKG